MQPEINRFNSEFLTTYLPAATVGMVMAISEVESITTLPAAGSDGGILAWLPARWLAAGVFAGLGMVLFFAYLTLAMKLPIFGDGAAQSLQAWDMLHGNLLLHGWVLSDVSFYTTELPQYMLIEMIGGLNPDVVHVAAAMTYALLVVLTAVLAKGRATGRQAVLRSAIAVGIMLAPQFGRMLVSRALSPAWVLLSAPDHTGTQVPLVLIWLVLDRLRPRWWLPLVVTTMLTWVEIADSTALFEGAIPIVVVCAMRMYRRRGPLAGQLCDLSLAVGGVASAGMASAALAVIRSHGGFAVNAAPPFLITDYSMTAHFWLKVRSVLAVFGADFFGLPATQAVIPLTHLLAVALVAWGVRRALRQFFASDDLAMQVLTVSFVVLLAAFIFGYRTASREAVGLLPIGAVLAGRTLALRVAELRLAPALAAVLACYGLSLFSLLLGPGYPSPDQSLASWLRAHHLTYGFSASWLASNGVTLYSQDRVRVRDVTFSADGDPVRVRWNTKASWYNPWLHEARFMILNPCAPKGTRRLIQIIGLPTATYRAAGFTVLVWRTNLLGSHPRQVPLPSRGRASLTRYRGQPDQTHRGNRKSGAYRLMCVKVN